MSERFHFKDYSLAGEIEVPGDKSISHRALMLASLAQGESVINRFLLSEDCNRTIEAFKALGVQIETHGDQVLVKSEGASAFKEPSSPLEMGNSGTTIRLLAGLLAAFSFQVTLTGDESLSKRPMERVITPLTKMGAHFQSITGDNKLPIKINGGKLMPITYHLPVDSAQVKSAIILAGLLTEGQTTVVENNPTRDHTEKMLPAFGGSIKVEEQTVTIKGKQSLKPTNLTVPGDQSSAAFWVAAALITPDSHIKVKEVGVNETRLGFVNVLRRMGANIKVKVDRYIGDEPIGTIEVSYSTLHPTTIKPNEVPAMIDEVPLLALVATQTYGDMTIEHIEELRYKETDRISATVALLKNLGANIKASNDQIEVYGRTLLKGGQVKTNGDHRMAMMAVIASIISEKPVTIDDVECIQVSYPNFLDDLRGLLKEFV
ncbi:3-phosphoshikimate 1-carboxyvinyltransferase [Alkalibacillus silvisoli]|uniref:3-phosphoshikimate 1-carboxyvinyltransferase n=1 Tax=Alkalibacillus silvisoli TaxID=392823 RepID=A0ABP3JMZ5_9BACI